MAGTILVSNIQLDSDNTFSILSNTGAALFSANTSGIDVSTSIPDGSITSAKIADGTVIAADIGDGTVTTAKIADANVTAAKIATDAVTTDKIADANVTVAKLESTLDLTGKTVSLNSPTISGNTAFDTSTLYINASDNRVGIGTSSPSVTLDIDSASSTIAKFTRSSISSVIYNSTGSGTSYFADSTLANSFGVNVGSNYVSATTNSLERLRITSAGYVGIGTTSPATTLDVSGSIFVSSILRNTNGGSAAAPSIQPGNDGDTGMFWATTNAIGFSTAGSEAVRIDSSGNVGIGTTSQANKLEVSGAIVSQGAVNSYTNDGLYLSNEGSGNFQIGAWRSGANASILSFGTDSGSDAAPVERMRIDSSGDVGIGVSPVGYRLRVRGDGIASTFAFLVENSAGQDNFSVRNDGRIYTGTDGDSPYNLTTGSAANMFVSSGGLLFRSTSSIKYKTDVQDATHGLDDVMKLRAVTYKGKSEDDGDTVFGGLIAEEVHDAGLTEFVQYDDDGNPDALAYGHMVSLAFKAIQELSAQNEALIARIEALENAS